MRKTVELSLFKGFIYLSLTIAVTEALMITEAFGADSSSTKKIESPASSEKSADRNVAKNTDKNSIKPVEKPISKPTSAPSDEKIGEASKHKTANGTQVSNQSINSASGAIKNVTQKDFLKYSLCKAGGVLRTLRVEATSKGCMTKYQRENAGINEEKTVATAASNAVCLQVLEKIQKNLEENKWECSDVTSSRMSLAE